MGLFLKIFLGSKVKKLCFCITIDSALMLNWDFPNLAWQAYHMILYLLKWHYAGSHTIRGQGSLLCVTGQPWGPKGAMSSLGSSPEFGEGQGLTMVSQRVLLQLTDGHWGEGARQALVCVLLTWRKIEKQRSTTWPRYKINCTRQY